jgi:hypothetical protein
MTAAVDDRAGEGCQAERPRSSPAEPGVRQPMDIVPGIVNPSSLTQQGLAQQLSTCLGVRWIL